MLLVVKGLMVSRSVMEGLFVLVGLTTGKVESGRNGKCFIVRESMPGSHKRGFRQAYLGVEACWEWVASGRIPN